MKKKIPSWIKIEGFRWKRKLTADEIKFLNSIGKPITYPFEENRRE